MMTPEDRAAQAIQAAALDWGGRYELDAPQLKTAIATAIRAAVAEALALADKDKDRAVAGEREACAGQLDEAAESYRNAIGDANKIVAMVLTVEAKGIRARSRGEGEG